MYLDSHYNSLLTIMIIVRVDFQALQVKKLNYTKIVRQNNLKLIEWANQQISLFITYCYPSGEIFNFLIEFNSQVLNFPCRYSIMCTSECSHFGLPVHVTQSFLKHFEEGEMFIVYICLTHVKCKWNQFKSGQSISWCIST